METLNKLGLRNYIDFVVCGDDKGTKPKPHPHNALKICETLNVDPEASIFIFLKYKLIFLGSISCRRHIS